VSWNVRTVSFTSPDWIKEASDAIYNFQQYSGDCTAKDIQQILTKHAAGLVEDKERLDWLEKHLGYAMMGADDLHATSWNLPNKGLGWDRGELRTAITAAMKGMK